MTTKRRGRPPWRCQQDASDWIEDHVDPVRCCPRLAYAQGNLAALRDAVAAALERAGDAADPTAGVLVPRWVLDALYTDVLPAHLRAATVGRGRGRHARWVEQFRQDAIDWRRFEHVWARRLSAMPETAAAAREKRAAWRRSRNWPRYRAAVGTAHPWDASSDPGDLSAFEAAAAELEGTPFGGSPGAIKKSYERVTRAIAAGEVGRYYPARTVVPRELSPHDDGGD